ncbi:S41 family peptidase [Flavobacterium quisquiliarum]|uniref:S41 family peptidase n=1 Tax=Flavobacterium quisquiliarum TaxID=1834436 RepID=A0ABV8W7S5_9FLAO|nr:S41 family peptidase [Flavobacterium quisquiliarum]MBW1657385.1 peptidase S41 [Flavobacterium quisquiliarum]NWL01914.1 peptidase S41 [Flavobacterium collinsii]
MQKITLFLFIIFSQTVFSAAKITETEKLVATCKVWGFLKYYHPKVAGGEVNWDKQLLEKLPKIEKAQTKEEFSLILEKWIDELGTIKEVAPISASKDVEYFDKNFDLSWFNNKLFSKNLSKKLKFIEENRFQGEQFYVYAMEYVGNIGMRNESSEDPDYTNKDSKLRMVFMLWNLIEYYFPYKYQMDQKWDITLDKIIPLAIQAKNHDDFFNLVIRRLMSSIDDSHTEVYVYPTSEARLPTTYFPANGKIIDDKVVVTEILADSLAQADNIKVGDVITKINNQTIKDFIAENKNLVSASNNAKYLEKIIGGILISKSDTVKVEFLKNGEYLTKTMIWHDYHDSHRNEFKKGAKKKKERFKLLDHNIGYVDMGILTDRNIPDMIELLKNTKAIVFDVRNYPKGTAIEISNFISPQENKFAIYTIPDLSYPGRFKWNNEGTSSGSDNKDNYKGKVVVLLNEKTQSHAEWTAMCFRASGNTTIIGSQTSGADGNISVFEFKAFRTLFSGIGVYYPDKRETQRIGIVPDIEVKPTIKGIQEGKDEVLDRALLFIETGK